MTVKTCDSCNITVDDFNKLGTLYFPEHLRELCPDCTKKIQAQLDAIQVRVKEYEAELKAEIK